MTIQALAAECWFLSSCYTGGTRVVFSRKLPPPAVNIFHELIAFLEERWFVLREKNPDVDVGRRDDAVFCLRLLECFFFFFYVVEWKDVFSSGSRAHSFRLRSLRICLDLVLSIVSSAGQSLARGGGGG